jgi:methylated-DNA-[protein]-cysteine S-methyltransferase
MRGQTGPSDPQGYALFDTPLGPCGVAWSPLGLMRLRLPEADRAATETRLRTQAPTARAGDPPPPIARVITSIRHYLDGTPVDFSAVPIDLAGVPPFHRRVYDAARAVGWGQTVSYGELARQAGSPGAARAVGQALARNPVAIVIPCHRILAGGRKVGGFTAFGGIVTKTCLLALEGVEAR